MTGGSGGAGDAGGVGTPRLVAIDVDGTLIGSDHSLAERTARAVAAVRAAGVTVAIASGRPFFVVGALARLADWVISGNGTQLTHVASGETPYEVTFPYAEAATFVREARVRVPDIRFALITDLHLGWEDGFEAFSPPDARPGERVGDVLVDVPGNDVLRLVAYHPEHDPTDLAPLLQGILPHLEAEHLGFPGVEIGPHGVDKALALAWLAGHLGIERADVWAFGDGINDVDMLRWVGRGIAMGNAHGSVLAVADEVTSSNDEHGVAVVLERVAAALG